MKVDPDGQPKVGAQSKRLGVRIPPDRHADVDVDDMGRVAPVRKGLSVTEDWRNLPGHLIPEHLDDGRNGASGRGMNVFTHGFGGFEEGPITKELQLLHKAGTTTAGVIAPTDPTLLAAYQQALALTRPDWTIDES